MSSFVRKYCLIFVVLFFFSCENFIGGDLNLDPNKPNKLAIELLLPDTQIALADTYGGSHSRYNGIHVQQVEVVARSLFIDFDSPERYEIPWEEFYTSILVHTRILRHESSLNGFNHYQGIANVMEAFAVMMATDVWDDMPYTEAADGTENPSYDLQEDIYMKIHQLLDEALELFTDSPGLRSPSIDDFIYSGNIENWILAVHGLKARAYLHYGDYENAFQESQNSFVNRSQSMSLQYPDVDYGSPWYQHNDSRAGDIEFSPTVRTIMLGFNDTDRLAILDNPFTINHPYLIADFKQDLISYREIKFIIAEAGLATGASPELIRDAYLNGIDASFQELGYVPNSTAYQNYISQSVIDPGVGNLTDDEILIQKYLGLFLQPEVFSDWRRKEIPTLTPRSGLNIPVRWNYSTDEFEFNLNAPSIDAINIYTDNVDWDN